jgi:hypothetical protein
MGGDARIGTARGPLIGRDDDLEYITAFVEAGDERDATRGDS